MSKSRQDDPEVLVRTFGVSFSHRQIVPPVSTDWNQLVYASRGVLTVRSDAGAWVVPPHRAIWLPANTPCTLEVTGETALRMLYLRSDPSSDSRPCGVINVSPLLRELVLRTVSYGVLVAENPHHGHLSDLIRDELKAADAMPLQLPLPQSEPARAFVAHFESGGFEVESAVRHSGVGRRTLERLFRAETAMSLGQWTRRRKLLEALRLLTAGETTANVAFHLGYNGPSAFIAMFKRELGATPTTYLPN